jgi:hypothetical protein
MLRHSLIKPTYLRKLLLSNLSLSIPKHPHYILNVSLERHPVEMRLAQVLYISFPEFMRYNPVLGDRVEELVSWVWLGVLTDE